MSMPTGNMDPYVYPGTSVLKNLRDIRNPELLSKFEMDMTTRRLSELARKQYLERFSTQHLQAIHKHIFKDVYAWAGQFRTVNISRSGDSFAFSEYINSSLNNIFEELRKDRYLGGSDSDQFSKRAAYYMGEINAIHPFRDGNGRTQRELIRQLARRNRYALDWSRVSQEQMYDASRQSFRQADYSGLEKVIGLALSTDIPSSSGRDNDR